MAITINGSGTISGITAGGLPDGAVTADDLASTLDLSGKTVTLPSGTGGKVLQVVQSTYTGTPASTSTSYTDTGLQISVTPVSSTSKFLIEVDCYFGTSSPYHDATVSVDIYDNNNGVQITPNGTSGTSVWNRWINLGEGFPNDAGADAQYHVRNGNGRVLYTPSTRYSPFVFKLRARANGFGGWIMNRNYTQTDTRGIQTVSTLTLMEIAA